MAEENKTEVVVCLGSSCFSRGNSQNLASLEAYLQNHGLSDTVRITGCLCQDECRYGPNLVVGGHHHHEVDGARLSEILRHLSTEAH